ncbi:metallophosphoesterase [Pseudonocardia sp.]|uniref:metallophosphoesterase n=1 Tax=Pseudonocardia sp. TaxID=60912 RepID=UPI003D130CE7
MLVVIPALLFAVPWWVLVAGGQGWPGPVFAAATVLCAAGAVALPVLLTLGHGRRHSDAAARVGVTLLGVVWVVFTWSVLGLLAESVLAAAGVADPLRSRDVTAAVLGVVAVLLVHGVIEARRVPRVREREVRLERLGPGLDGLRVVVLADTHFGPIERSRWSARVVEVVNGLRPDVVVHAGDLADGSVAARDGQVRPLGDVRAPLGRFYIPGNHEHFSGAVQWIEYLQRLGWQPLVNTHRVVERGGDRLVLAGIDDPTGVGKEPGGGPDLPAALDGADPASPVLLLAHQPRQVVDAVSAGVDLQVSGHTHGGQIWPFHLLVRTEQPVLSGLSRHGPRTQLYTSRGTGFWGPPLRVFAPSEITVLTLRRA